MAQKDEFRMPSFAEQQQILRRAEVLRAQAAAEMVRALGDAVLRLCGARRAAAQ